MITEHTPLSLWDLNFADSLRKLQKIEASVPLCISRLYVAINAVLHFNNRSIENAIYSLVSGTSFAAVERDLMTF